MSKKSKKNKINLIKEIIGIIIVVCAIYSGYITTNEATETPQTEQTAQTENNVTIDLSTIPEYTTKPYVEINNNKPYFTEQDYTTEAFEKYSDWVNGRSGVAYANICKETMPKSGEKRGDISNVKDLSGWVQKRYDNLIKDKYLYNRCHLIGWQLSAENDNKKNLITGTRYLNTEGMLPFENLVASYIDDNQNNHVLYRVTPIFEGDNQLASGVEMEALSVEDKGQAICFNVYCYNVQPGIVIDYSTGESHAEE